MTAPGARLGGQDERRFEVLGAPGGGAMGQAFSAGKPRVGCTAHA
ncbi:hypothetical protein [Archangium violaceum]|nr:hypothetical protein [Archangium violaceum]